MTHKTADELAGEYAYKYCSGICKSCGLNAANAFKAGYAAAIEMLRGEGAYYSLVNDDLRVDHCADWLERQRDNK